MSVFLCKLIKFLFLATKRVEDGLMCVWNSESGMTKVRTPIVTGQYMYVCILPRIILKGITWSSMGKHV